MVPIRTILDLIRAYEGGFTAISACRELNVALPTAYKYYRRFKAEGFIKGKFQRNHFYVGSSMIGKVSDDPSTE